MKNRSKEVTKNFYFIENFNVYYIAMKQPAHCRLEEDILRKPAKLQL